MLEFLRVTIIIMAIFLVVVTLGIFVLTVTKFWKSRRLFKSSFNSTFKTLLSTTTIVLFYGLSFSIIGGTINAEKRISTQLTTLTKGNNLFLSSSSLDSITNFKGEHEEIQVKDDYTLFISRYFNNNLSKPKLLMELEGLKIISSTGLFSYSDLKNLNWTYQLSHYWTNTASEEGYQYVGLNNINIFKMTRDYLKADSSGKLEINPYDDKYLFGYDEKSGEIKNPDYRKSNILQDSNVAGKDSQLYINDFQVMDGNINDVYANNKVRGPNEDYDVNIAIGYDWAKFNHKKVGDIIELPMEFSTPLKGKIVATVRAPQFTFPSFSFLKPIPNTHKQTYIFLDTKTFLEQFGDIADSTIYLGFSDLYEDIESYSDFTSSYIKKRIRNYNVVLTSIISQSFNNVNLKELSNISGGQTSLRANMSFKQLKLMKVLDYFLLTLFITITIFILVVLLKKRVRSMAPEIGTLKALGWTDNRIAVTFISFPITVIILGGVVAILLSFLIQYGWMTIWNKRFLIGSGHVTLSFLSMFLTFIFPIFILFAVSYLASKKLLKKPSIDLINNVVEYKPSILVRASGKITNNFKSFERSYRVKNIARGFGKSTILFTSILFTLIVVSFSLSATNLINSTAKSALKIINAEDIISLNGNVNKSNLITESEFKDEPYYLIPEISKATNEEEVDSIISNMVTINPEATDKETFLKIDEELFASHKDDSLTGKYLPWQNFEAINWMIQSTLERDKDSSIDWEKDDYASESDISFLHYQNVYNQYLKTYEYNNSLKSKNEEVIRPSFSIGSVVYDDSNISASYNSLIDWTSYEDKNSHKKINSFNDLGFHKTSSDSFELYRQDEKDAWKYSDGPHKDQKYEGDSVWAKSQIETNPDYYGDDYVESKVGNIKHSSIESEYDETDPDHLVLVKQTQDVLFDRLERDSVEKNRSYLNNQWISSFDSVEEANYLVNFSKNTNVKLDELNNYKQTTDPFSNPDAIGSEDNLAIVPIIIDSFNAKRLGLSKGQIIYRKQLDEFARRDSQFNGLDNQLKIESSTYDSLAIQVVDVYKEPLPLGAITLNKFLNESSEIPSLEGANKNSNPYTDEENQLVTFMYLKNNKQIKYYPANESFSGSTVSDLFGKGNNFSSMYTSIFNKSSIEEQILFVISIVNLIFYAFAFFASFISVVLIILSIKEIADSVIPEISTLKTLGYSNWKSTFLILTPYIIIMLIAVVISLGVNILFFALLSSSLSNAFGIGIWLGMPIWQWAILLVSIILLFAVVIAIIFYSFSKVDPVDALKAIN